MDIIVHPSTIIGATSGTVTERGVANPDEPETATGMLNLFRGFVPQTDTAGTYGAFTLVAMTASTSVWTYTLDNADTDTNALAEDATVNDVFTVVSVEDSSLTQDITITITGANDAPIADAGMDQDVLDGADVTLDGSASRDPDSGDTIVSYIWMQIGGSLTFNTARPTFTAPGPRDGPTVLTFRLVVNDGTADSASADVTVTAESNDAALRDPDPDMRMSGLTISDGVLNFDSATFEYEVEVATTVTSVTVRPTARDSDHEMITVNEVPVASGVNSGAIALMPGVRETITIVVTAENGTTQTYMLDVTRLPDTSLGDLVIRNTDIIDPDSMPPNTGEINLIQTEGLPNPPTGTPTRICDALRARNVPTGFRSDITEYIVCADSTPGDANQRTIQVEASVTEQTEIEILEPLNSHETLRTRLDAPKLRTRTRTPRNRSSGFWLGLPAASAFDLRYSNGDRRSGKC